MCHRKHGNIIHCLVVKGLVDVESISETVVAGVDGFGVDFDLNRSTASAALETEVDATRAAVVSAATSSFK